MKSPPLSPPLPPPFPRHTLVWPVAAARDDLLAQAPDASARAAIAHALAAAWPLVVRRVDSPAAPSPAEVAVGLALPPAEGKRRLAFALQRRQVARHAPPLSLRRVAAALPSPWHRLLVTLDRDAQALGVALRVFGAAAWQALTGLGYLSEDSDIDLVFRPAAPAHLDATLALFDAWEARTHRRVDAEIVFAGERAVAWQEWRQADGADARVLVKSRAGAALVARADLLASLAPVPA